MDLVHLVEVYRVMPSAFPLAAESSLAFVHSLDAVVKIGNDRYLYICNKIYFSIILNENERKINLRLVEGHLMAFPASS